MPVRTQMISSPSPGNLLGPKRAQNGANRSLAETTAFRTELVGLGRLTSGRETHLNGFNPQERTRALRKTAHARYLAMLSHYLT